MIRVLDRTVSELIAAGEVIERPASVVKELIENSIDAGSKSITVEIKNGGITFLRISDDGVGIPHEQCPTAFLRHATSKVNVKEDLEEISTLGFRGEALASVAAVSRLNLLTKTAGSTFGTSYKIEGGIELEHTQAGCADGTTLIIRDLFYNMPARLKFLKKDVTEGNYVQSVIDKIALVNPSVAFRFIRDNKLVRVTPGDGEMLSVIYAVYGKDLAASMLSADCSQNGIRVYGYVSHPLFSKCNRAFQNFYVNSRFVRSSTFVAALEEAYRNSIMTGKFPACVLNLEINPANVDANVHPAKTEVRFTDDRVIFNAIHIAVKNALLNRNFVSTTEVWRSAQTTQIQGVSSTTTLRAMQREQFAPPSLESRKMDYVVAKPPKVIVDLPMLQAEYKYINPDMLVKNANTSKKPAIQHSFSGCENANCCSKYENIRILGELFANYILCEHGAELLLLDKHAADERIRFEWLKTELKSHSQLLLEPFEITLEETSCGLLHENSENMEIIGLKIEQGRAGEVRVLATPTILGELSQSKMEELLADIANSLSVGRSGDNLAELCVVDNILHRIACRGAIKAGDKSPYDDIEQLAKRVLEDDSGTLQYCPHGRPIVVRITKIEIEKMFKRVL
jgi:DNA mismatch repair protein MutL